jgi:hypothetical protein
MENDYKNRLENIKLNISESEGLEKANEIIESLEYIIKINDEHIYPFITYQQSNINYWINKHKELNNFYNRLIDVNYKLRNELFFGFLISGSLNLIFIIIHYLR